MIIRSFGQAFHQLGTGDDGVVKNGDGAYIAFIAFYAICFAVTWAAFIRRRPARLEGV